MKEINTYPYIHKAQYYETDQMGVIHNSNYFRWFEEARTYFMETIGVPYAKMEELGMLIVMMASSCEYKQPVHYGEEAVIHQRLIFYNGYKMTVRYEVYRKSDGTLCAVGETKHALIGKDRRPIRLSKEHPEMHEVFLSYTFPLDDDES